MLIISFRGDLLIQQVYFIIHELALLKIMLFILNILVQVIYYNCLFLDAETVSDIEIISSLLYCFQGVDSQWIVFNQNEKQFECNAKVSF